MDEVMRFCRKSGFLAVYKRNRIMTFSHFQLEPGIWM